MGYSILLCFEHTVCGYVFRRNEFLYIIYVTRESLELVTSTFNNSVFSLFTNTFHYFFYFLIDLFLCPFYFCDKSHSSAYTSAISSGMLLSIFSTHLGFMSLHSIGSFYISSFICWRGLVKYSVKSGPLILSP